MTTTELPDVETVTGRTTRETRVSRRRTTPGQIVLIAALAVAAIYFLFPVYWLADRKSVV